jgi:mono/diheme cytochrome c family protein
MPSNRIKYLSFGLWVFLAAFSFSSAVKAHAAQLQSVVSQNCLSCHNEKMKAGGLALDSASAARVADHPEVWEKVLRKLRARQMPPVGRPRPDEATYDALVDLLATSLDRAAAAEPNPGRTDTVRRLTRTEYQNAIRDLLAIEVDLSSTLPRDESSQGFDNITVTDLSPTLLEAYVAAADKISRLALGRPLSSPDVVTVTHKADVTQEKPIEDLPVGTRGGTVFNHTFPVDGEYEIVVRLTRDRDEQVEGLKENHEVEVLLDRQRIGLFTVTPRGGGDHSDVDTHLKLRIPIKAGPHEIGATFLKQPWAALETNRKPLQVSFNAYRHPRFQPAVYEVSVAGPYNSPGPGDSPSRKRILLCRPNRTAQEVDCARRIATTLMQRAYRRPVKQGDLDNVMAFYRRGQAEGGFEAGIEMAVSSILVSPDFLFRVERDPAGIKPNTAYQISDVELASRISFFLWSSIPDDELLELAIQGKLRRPEVLEQQVRRMLADARSQTLITNFASQWLQLRNLESSTPDMRLYPDFDDNLRQAMRRETELFLESIVREDRSVLDLISADYTFLNERLAKHYAIPRVYGSRFRRVMLDKESQKRGGLLRQGSILTVTSYNTRTSPVLRGHWVLKTLLGVPPPPPPNDVPPFPEKTISGSLSVRQRLVEHRTNPACSGCHSLMDPLGFSLENYDAIGRWRNTEEDQPIDATGDFPGGTSFDSVSGLEKSLLARPDIFVGNMVEKLVTYSLGRGVQYYDAPAVRKIVQDARSEDFRFSALIVGITKSKPFQMRRSQ